MLRLRTVLPALLGALATVSSIAAEPADRGQAVYMSTCVACHGKDGKGAVPGTPNLRKKGGVLAKTDEELVRNTLNGYQSPGSPLAMPPKGGNPALTEADARAVVRYIRGAFAP